LRVGAPMMVNDALMDDASRLLVVDEDDEDGEDDEEFEAVSEDELLAELRDFLDTVNPEDFDL